MPAPREIFYLYPFRFPSATAHSIQVLNTCRALAMEGAQVRLMVKRNSDRAGSSVGEGLAFYGLEPHPGLQIDVQPANNILRSLTARWRVMRAARGTCFYARHIGLAATAARLKKGPLILELHALEKGMKGVVRRADGIVTITTALGDRVRELYAPKAQFDVIPDGVDASVFAPVSGAHPARLVYMGQFHDWKGVDVLIRSLRLLPKVTAFIAGGQPGGDPRADVLRELAGREGVNDRIEWAGFLPQRQLRASLRGGDIGILPTRAQNGQELAASPLKLFEYMAAGLPVVASDLPALRDVIHPGVNGLLFREGDPEALAASVRRLIDSSTERQAIVDQASRDADQFSWRGRARRILALFGRLPTSS